MIEAVFGTSKSVTVYGVTQWDYGQEIHAESAEIEIPDGTEAQFYQGNLSHLEYMQAGTCRIPDQMLQHGCDITMYIYVRAPASAETILSAKIRVEKRPRPENYVLPAYEEYKRLMPDGGQEGQVLAKRSDAPYDTEWRDGAGIEALTEEEVDEICQ
ncbi:MAG: hypothetical protein Q4C60_07785 [Eubacteriales bacterium]|nr:hypothetical protein [Eubacteriales bacterium]